MARMTLDELLAWFGDGRRMIRHEDSQITEALVADGDKVAMLWRWPKDDRVHETPIRDEHVSDYVAELSQLVEIAQRGGSGVISIVEAAVSHDGPHAQRWSPSDALWDEGTFAYGTPDGIMVISAFPSSNDGGGYSVNQCSAVPCDGSYDGGQYLGYESVSQVLADCLVDMDSTPVWRLCDVGCECEGYDALCQELLEVYGVDIVPLVADVRAQMAELGRVAQDRG